MKGDIDTFESIGASDIIDQDDSMNVIDFTWAFKCKRYTDGLI